MGIPGYFGKYLSQQNFPDILIEKLSGNIRTVSIDFNGLLYDVAHEVFNPETNTNSNLEQRYGLFYQSLGERLQYLIQATLPQFALIIAVDGIPPMAKAMQQRSRRYRSSLDRQTKEKPLMIDTNQFSPGTPLMNQIDQFLNQWISNNQKFLPSTVIYSSHMEPGEAEHKIMDIYRSWVNNPTHAVHKTEGYHVLVGKDTDLFLLMLMTGLKNGMIWREQFEPPQKMVRKFNKQGREIFPKYRFLSCEGIKNLILQKMNLPMEQLNLAIRDFTLMTSFLGNDFLPHPPSLEDMTEAPEKLFRVYQQVGVPLTASDGIIWGNLAKFFTQLGKDEPTLINHEANRTVQHPSRLYQATAKMQEVNNPEFNSSSFSLQPQTILRREVDFGSFRSYWYRYALRPGTLGPIKLLYSSNVDEAAFQPGLSLISMMTQEYLKMINWVYCYYSYGNKYIRQTWHYPFYFTPLFVDVAAILTANLNDKNFLNSLSPLIRNDPNIPLFALHLMILPPNNLNLLPPILAPLMQPGSPLIWMLPYEFQIETNGKDADHTTFPLLPFPNLPEVVRILNSWIEMQTPAIQAELKALSQVKPQMVLYTKSTERWLNPDVSRVFFGGPIREAKEKDKARPQLGASQTSTPSSRAGTEGSEGGKALIKKSSSEEFFNPNIIVPSREIPSTETKSRGESLGKIPSPPRVFTTETSRRTGRIKSPPKFSREDIRPVIIPVTSDGGVGLSLEPMIFTGSTPARSSEQIIPPASGYGEKGKARAERIARWNNSAMLM